MTAAAISFAVPGRIGGKQRAGRQVLRSGRVHTFNPSRTASQEGVVRHFAAETMRVHKLRRIDGPVCLAICVWLIPPKSWSKKKQANALHVTGKPDPDNVAKLIADALNGITYRDDSQISMLFVARRYTRTPLEYVSVTITPLSEGEPQL